MINFFSPQSKAGSWEYLSHHSAEQMGESMASIVLRLHLHFTPRLDCAGYIRAPRASDKTEASPLGYPLGKV